MNLGGGALVVMQWPRKKLLDANIVGMSNMLAKNDYIYMQSTTVGSLFYGTKVSQYDPQKL